MNPFQGLREYERSSPWPEKTPISIRLKDGLSFTVSPLCHFRPRLACSSKNTSQLNVPNFGVAASSDDGAESKAALTRVVLAHAAFKAAMQPEFVPNDSFFKTCVAEVNVISLFFPDIASDAVRIVFTAWLAFACIMDDILEVLDLVDRELVLKESIEILTHGKLPLNSLNYLSCNAAC